MNQEKDFISQSISNSLNIKILVYPKQIIKIMYTIHYCPVHPPTFRSVS